MVAKTVAGILDGVETKGGSLILRLLTKHLKDHIHEIIVTLAEDDVSELRAALDRIHSAISKEEKPNGPQRTSHA
jgi:hypothetical protein